MRNKLKKQTLNGVLWNFTERFLSRGFSVIITLFLAWFLSPEDYALIAMITVFISLSQVIVDGGLGQALIRKLDADERDNNTVFYTNLLLSVFIYECTPACVHSISYILNKLYIRVCFFLCK